MVSWQLRLLLLLLSLFCCSCMTIPSKEIFGVKGSGWKSASWNWGSAMGTGHDCAAICRRRYQSHESRQELVQNLIHVSSLSGASRVPENFEEVKLVLALAWQRGRWDGSDGGPGGYGDVLSMMAKAVRYEDGSEEECSCQLVQDMMDRYTLLNPTTEEQDMMNGLWEYAGQDYDLAQRRCSGLVLSAMGFASSGL